ncbi:hypothetical protein J2Z75_001624 [Rhizobium herbae]|uniref:Uncharacterized protein n=1 Tax=Rhizobium herbae TaxID=508661 RepID=A0ABS4EJK8_9HYPH|nr:hypothetical protein [Rhizobium herbae]
MPSQIPARFGRETLFTRRFYSEYDRLASIQSFKKDTV